ncbi:MAG TPA: hypothetical protein VGE76_21280 [Opitutaceae bacterium]
MGFFDRFSSKKPEPARNGSAPAPASAAPAPAPQAPAAPAVANVSARLAEARAKLDLKDLPGAMAVYEEILNSTSGDRADVLVAISGDLGSRGHIPQIVELIAPRYDAERHGPATGVNLIQAYLALRNAEAAQHVLDILFALNRPELEQRLFGFSNAIAEIINSGDGPITNPQQSAPDAPGIPKIGLITISKPIWCYGLEPLAAQILPAKGGKLRRIAFAQLALPGYDEKTAAALAKKPDDELPRLSRAIPLWFAETFYFSPHYQPWAAVGLMTMPEGGNHHVVFGTEWTTENLRQLVETTEGGLDYIFTGALRVVAGDYEIALRVWEVKNYRERKIFTARWTPSTVETALAQLHEQVRAFMEWTPGAAAVPYVAPAQPRAWLETLATSLTLFLGEKGVMPLPADTAAVAEALQAVAQRAAASEAASLAWLSARYRAGKVGVAAPSGVALASSAIVAQADRIA